jgi:hypothetical protein
LKTSDFPEHQADKKVEMIDVMPIEISAAKAAALDFVLRPNLRSLEMGLRGGVL